VGVRRIRPEEWAELRDVRLRALEDSPDSFGSTAVEALRRDDHHWRAWAETGASSPTTAVFVADGGGKLVGLCGAFLHEDDSRIAQIVAMWVAPDLRGRGLADELLDAATRWSIEQDAEDLVLDVTETNQGARRLYERAGFRETGTRAPLRSNPGLLTREMRKPLRLEFGTSLPSR
jgi:ribosomal protein S18 acetylase RimI-like enzyme